MDILNIIKTLFFSVFSIDFTVYIIISWAVVSMFFIVLNALSGRRIVKK